jgi:cellulose synthase/poly-beta-1,6-N-acetylglucosamine synthase-like glycosyltransferase
LYEQTYDAFMMLDADWTVSSNLLEIANAYLDRGEEVVQVWCRVARPTATWATGLRSISFALVNYVRPLGLNRLGLSCGLKGTGMAFTTEILRRHGWQSTSLIEDAEEHIRLILHGHRVAFAPEATIESVMPPTLKASTSQNLRWESGKVALGVGYVPMLLRHALSKPSVDAAVEAVALTIPPLTVTVAALAAMSSVSLAIRSRLFLTASLVLWGGLLSHVSLGVYAARLPVRLLVSVLLAPSFVVWKLRLYAGALSSRGKGQWIRTERASEGKK